MIPEETNAPMLAAKILVGLSVAMTTAAGATATWTAVQQPESLVIDETLLIPAGVVITLMATGIVSAVKVVRYLDRITSMEQDVQQLMTVCLGPKDEQEGVRRGGLMEKMDRVLQHLEESEEEDDGA